MSNNLETSKKVMAVSMLCEGSSIRSIERVTGIHRDTIMRLGVRVGKGCQQIMDTKMRGLNCKHVQCDEIWGFVGSKNKNAATSGRYGDVWTFIALDAETKIIPSHVVGKRDMYHAQTFMEDLAGRMANRIQVSTDGLAAYPDAIERGFGSEVDYGQIVKTYSVTNLVKSSAGKYSPADVIKVERTVVSGMPDVNRICTSHIESQNLTLRMHCRRLTRLTNAFSKKIENFAAAVAMNFAYYNFCKTHTTLRMTPAQRLAWKTAHGRWPNSLNVVANKAYIERLIQVICHLHKSDAKHIGSVPVEEIFQGRTIWKGVVEVFDLESHPKAKRAFAWSHRAGEDDSDERFVAVLEIPPVTSPETAVKVAIAAEVKGKR